MPWMERGQEVLTLDLWVFHHQQDGPLERRGYGLRPRHDQVKYGCY